MHGLKKPLRGYSGTQRVNCILKIITMEPILSFAQNDKNTNYNHVKNNPLNFIFSSIKNTLYKTNLFTPRSI